MTEQDKQALIKHFCERDCGEAAENCEIMPCHEIELIQEFKTTEPDSDTISRHAAIETVMECYDNDELFEVYEDKLRELPLAQPERIIHCKDCEWWTKQECSPQGRCALSGMYPTGGWFCGNARRREVTT